MIQNSNATFLSLFYYKSIQNFVCGLSVYIYYPLCLEVRSLSINYYSVAVPTSHNQFNQISKEGITIMFPIGWFSRWIGIFTRAISLIYNFYHRHKHWMFSYKILLLKTNLVRDQHFILRTLLCNFVIVFWECSFQYTST